jgi:hypothetical protein
MTHRKTRDAARSAFQALTERIQTHKGINGHAPLSNNRIAEKDDIKKGAFHKWLGKSPDSPITNADIEKGLKSKDAHVRKMAQFAKNMREAVAATMHLPMAGRFYVVSDRGQVLEDNGGHGFVSLAEAKSWFGQQGRIKGRLGVGEAEGKRFGQAIREGSELLADATDIDLSGFASDKTEPLKRLLQQHGVEHEIQGSKLHLHNSDDAHFVVDAMADIEAGHTPSATEAEQGEYEVAYVDNNGKMKRKAFKTDAAREKWITDQGSNIEVDSYRDPEPKPATEAGKPGPKPAPDGAVKYKDFDSWEAAAKEAGYHITVDLGTSFRAFRKQGDVERDRVGMFIVRSFTGRGTGWLLPAASMAEGNPLRDPASKIMRGKGYKPVGEAGAVDLSQVSYEDLFDEIVRRWAVDYSGMDDDIDLPEDETVKHGLEEIRDLARDDAEFWDALNDQAEEALGRLLKKYGLGESFKRGIRESDLSFDGVMDQLARVLVDQTKEFADEEGETFADEKEAIASTYEQVIRDSSSWEDLIDGLGDAFQRMYGGPIPGGPGA